MTDEQPKTQAELLALAKSIPYDHHDFGAQIRVLINYILHTYPLDMPDKQAFIQAQAQGARLRKKIEQVYRSKQAIIKKAKHGRLPDVVSLNAIAEAVIQMVVHEGVEVNKITATATAKHNRWIIEKALPYHKLLKEEADLRLKQLIQTVPNDALKKLMQSINRK